VIITGGREGTGFPPPWDVSGGDTGGIALRQPENMSTERFNAFKAWFNESVRVGHGLFALEGLEDVLECLRIVNEKLPRFMYCDIVREKELNIYSVNFVLK